MDVLGRLRLAIIRKGLDTRIMVNNCGTIDLCDIGPNMVVYPDNIIFGGVTAADIPDIVAFLSGGPVVERLQLAPGKNFEGKRQAFYAEIVGMDDESEEAVTLVAQKHDLDEVMLEEQFRRGFMARKPVEDGDGNTGEMRVHPTKKALTRYGLLSVES
jgi:(2Fe-2S) ferredoxin